MNTATAIVKTLRPRQWVKNAFVLAPLVFSRHLFDSAYALDALLAAAAFCAASGSVYTFNDVRDVEEDRLHPVKCQRPIAAGHLSIGTARVLALVLAAVGLLAPLVLN
ncbi:MAG: UbiA family prenyltransferase, partial [Deltaproteobacteria bacterium]|nr:UbiA family prenyltransferase [Deltaproteobacteria bacterium]